MKKLLLAFGLTAFAGLLSLNAQSFQLFHSNGGAQIAAGSTVTIVGDTSVGQITFACDVKNNSSSSKRVMVKKRDVALLGIAESFFCWAQCYPSFVYVALEALPIAAGQKTSNFTGDLDHMKVLGTHKVCYTFFDSLNISDSINFYVDFRVTGVGMNEFSNINVKIGNPFPNPSTVATSISYKLSEVPSGTYAAIYNMVGQTVATFPITLNTDVIKLPVSDMENGLYFFTIVIDERTTVTRKFTVSH